MAIESIAISLHPGIPSSYSLSLSIWKTKNSIEQTNMATAMPTVQRLNFDSIVFALFFPKKVSAAPVIEPRLLWLPLWSMTMTIKAMASTAIITINAIIRPIYTSCILYSP